MAEHVDPLYFPGSCFKKKNGFSIDMGSSSIKIAYAKEVGDQIKVEFKRFANGELDKALAFLSDICRGKVEPGSEIFVTGIGLTANMEKISTHLDVRLTTISEGQAFDAMFFNLKHQRWDAICHSPSTSSVEYASGKAKMANSWFRALGGDNMVLWPYMEDVNDSDDVSRQYMMAQIAAYPIILSHIGSLSLNFLVNEDGSFKFLELPRAGGRTFLGLASLIVGVHDFDELAELALAGDSSNVDQWLSSLAGKEEGSVYEDLARIDVNIFPFGHAHGKTKDDFRREDLAAALFDLIISTVVQNTYMWASNYNVKQIFFFGGMACSHQYVRDQIEKEFAYQRFANSKGHVCDCRVLKHGAHLPVLWGLYRNLGIQ